MLMSEFKNASQYTKGLLNTKKESLILFVACLIPIVNLFVLARYVNKIIIEPSTNQKPPILVKPNWDELIISLLKIAIVAIAWVLVIVVLAVLIGLVFGAGTLGAITGLMTLIEKLSARSIIAAVAGAIIVFVVGLFAVMSEVHMLKRKNLNAAFAFKDLLSNITKIGWPRYILFVFSALISILIVLRILMFSEIGILNLCLVGILTILPATFMAKTISLLYDKNSPQPTATV